MVTLGSGGYRYEPVEDWPQLPAGWSFREIGGIGVDGKDNVYVLNRGEHPMMVSDRDGIFLRAWGEGCIHPRPRSVCRPGPTASRSLTATASMRRSRTTCTVPSLRPVHAGREMFDLWVGELGPMQPVNRDVPNLGPRVSIVDHTGKRQSRLGGLCPGLGVDQFLAPHALCVDSRGDLYVGEVAWTQWPQAFPKDPTPQNRRSQRKFRRLE